MITLMPTKITVAARGRRKRATISSSRVVLVRSVTARAIFNAASVQSATPQVTKIELNTFVVRMVNERCSKMKCNPTKTTVAARGRRSRCTISSSRSVPVCRAKEAMTLVTASDHNTTAMVMKAMSVMSVATILKENLFDAKWRPTKSKEMISGALNRFTISSSMSVLVFSTERRTIRRTRVSMSTASTRKKTKMSTPYRLPCASSHPMISVLNQSTKFT